MSAVGPALWVNEESQMDAVTAVSGSGPAYFFLLIEMLEAAGVKLGLNPDVAQAAGFDMIWFGVLTVVAVEVGLLTPPFGLSVYTIRSAIDDDTLKVGLIFRGALPFVATMLVMLLILIAFPPIATWLARL
jgi:TRAP-type mannitol/chloroaromatic compound transport system permease large subunit